MKAILGLSLVLASVTAFPQAQDSPPALVPHEQPRVLTPAGRVKFGIPAFGSIGNAVCDASGNLFFNVSSLIYQKGPFLGISADGRKHTVFTLPQVLGPRGNLVWTVTPGGTFFVLHQNFKDYRLIRFKDDGSVESISLLAVPPGVNVLHMAIIDNGMMFARGFRSSREPGEKIKPGFAALLNAQGKLARDLSSGAPEVDMKTAALHPLEGEAVAGEDGRFYILEAEDVLVLNQAGDVERLLKFKKPDSVSVALRVDYSKGIVSVLLFTGHPKPGEATEVDTRALLLNAQTGELRNDFVFDPETTANVICFSAQDGYSLAAIDGKLEAKDVVPIR
jgi:hypothetical protein